MDSPSISLRTSLSRRLALVLASIGVIGTIAAYILGASYANLAYDRALADEVVSLGSQVSAHDGRIKVTIPEEALAWLLADEGDIVRYRITDLRSMDVASGNGDLGEVPIEIMSNGQVLYRNYDSGGRRMRVAYMRQLTESTDIPVLVEIGETTIKRDQAARSILLATILFMGVMIAVAVGLVRHGVNTVLAPLKLLETEAAQRTSMDLKPLNPMHAPQEVRGLIEAINRLMARVSSVVESQSHFIANAAHQLRTPLAGLSLQAQLAKQASSPDEIRASLDDIEVSAAKAAHLIEQLLVLAKTEATDPSAPVSVVNLAEVAKLVIERYLPIADRRRMDLGYEGDGEDLWVKGSDTLFFEMLGNLVDNALRYGREGGRVTIATRRSADEIVVSISDNGPGFSKADRDQVFQRFYRSDSAPQGGAGLGLAIVREIAERYGGRLSLGPNSGKGACVELYFPDSALAKTV